MGKTVFCWDEDVKTNVTFHVMTRPEMPDRAGSDIPDTAGRKTRRTQAVAKRYAFHANAISPLQRGTVSLLLQRKIQKIE